MGTIESRLAALEKLYYNQSIQLATCRLEVVALQDVLILFGETDPDGADLSIEDFRRGVWALMPSEPTSAAARQLLGLPVQDVRMQEDEPTDAPIDWLQATHTVSGKPVYDLVLRPQGDIYGRVGDEADGNALRWFPTTGRCCEAPFSGSDLRKPEPSTKPKTKKREYPALRWVSGRDIGGEYPQNNWYARLGPWHIGWILKDGRMASLDLVDGCTSVGFVDESEARLWLESKFREWFDSLFDQPKADQPK